MVDISFPLGGTEAEHRRTMQFSLLKMMPPVLVFLGGFLIAYWLLAAIPGFVGTDDYYHSRIAAQIIEQRSLRVDFPWLPRTILSPDQFVDHHLLYHLYLAPWMHWGGITGVKIAQSLVVAAIGVAFWLLLRHLQVRQAVLWTMALLAVSSPFLYRMLMIRTQSMAVLLLLLALYALFSQRYRWLIPLAFAFTWLYNGFILLPVMVGLYAVSVWITEQRLTWKPVLYALAGMLLGLIINPYFPQNIAFIASHLGEKVDIGGSIRVGSEWYAYTTAQLLEHSLGAFLILGIGLLAGSFRKSGRDAAETTLLLMALLTLFMLFQSRRFIEYFPIFALAFGAVALGRPALQWRPLAPLWVRPHIVAFGLPVGLALVVLLLAAGVLEDTRRDIDDAKSLTYLAGAATWLAEQTEPGEMIFQTDWDDFTRLFFHNTHNTYLVGLDPTYLQVADPQIWDLWVAITRGEVERPSVLIRENFGARFVVSDTRHPDFAQRAENDPAMQLVYRDDNSLVWRIATAE